MHKHEHYEELCALAAVGQLSDDEYAGLAGHLGGCLACRESVDKFSLVLNHLPSSEPEPSSERLSKLHLASYRERFLNKAEAKGFRFSSSLRRKPERQSLIQQLTSIRVSLWIPAFAMASLVFVLAMTFQARNLPRAQQQVARINENETINAAPAASLLSTASAEHEQPQAVLTTTQDDTALVELESKTVGLETALQSSKVENQQIKQQLGAAWNAASEAQAKLDATNAELMQAKSNLDKMQTERAGDSASLVAQQIRINDLSAQLVQQRQNIAQEQQLTAATGDVRQMMGARNLHIIDVYDVDGKGKAQKSFGRIFYTEGKSLLFYAFDLGQKSKSGVTKVSFQAWGQREAGGAVPKNLGILTMDDREQQRWVLRIDDPGKFNGIDSLFVTVERHGGTDKPTGQKLLYAYIGTPANHP